MSAAAIKGIQSSGVAATLKHYVCNDLEHQRQSINSIVTERTLREIYLMPFQIAQRDSKPMAYMTAYNKVNGTHVSQDKRLLRDVLRGEWGFDGMIMSDWFGTYTTNEAVKAGLDLEMPGPSYIRGKQVLQSLTCGTLTEFDVDNCAREVLKFVKKVLPLGIPEHAPEGTNDTPEAAKLLRKLAADGIVLLKNEENILPFSKNKSTAVIGPNSRIATYCGGGSAALRPYYAISPLDGVRNKIQDVKSELGAPGWKKLPYMTHSTKTKDGKTGMTMKVFTEPPTETARQPIDEFYVEASECILADYKNDKLTSDLYWTELEGLFTPEESSDYEFSLSVAGTGKIFVDGNEVVDNETVQHPGDSFFGMGTREEEGSTHLEKGKTYSIVVKFGTLPTMKIKATGAPSFGAGGLRVGLHRKVELQTEIQRAVDLAKSVDQVVLCIGLNGDWESEGYDRQNMDLPPGSNELITAVLAANKNTAIVNQSGTPVSMPWLANAPALLQAWYGGNETGNAIADVLFGDVNPSGKLSLSFPIRNEDNPAFLNFRSERRRVLYGEEVYIGYRFYEKVNRAVAFPFGFGLSYTTFTTVDLQLTASSDDELTVSVNVKNTGDKAGAQVVQVYISQDDPSIGRPPKELKGFTKVFLQPGEERRAQVKLSKKYACSFWDEERDAWVMEKGNYTVHVGDCSANVPLTTDFEVPKSVWWRGL
ncbi:hypothetical protein R6Q59_009841 [Mikania micrantha]